MAAPPPPDRVQLVSPQTGRVVALDVALTLVISSTGKASWEMWVTAVPSTVKQPSSGGGAAAATLSTGVTNDAKIDGDPLRVWQNGCVSVQKLRRTIACKAGRVEAER